MAGYAQANTFFGVDLDLLNVGVEVRVNDIPIYEDKKSGQLTVELPCPDSIINDINSLSVIAILPKIGKTYAEDYVPGAYVSAKLFRQENDGKKEYLTKFVLKLDADGVLSPVDTEVESIQKPMLERIENKAAKFTVYAKIESPFPVWAWQSGLDIEANSENFDGLYLVYKEIHGALASNDQSSLKKLYSQRAKEIATAYNLNDEAAGHEKISTGKDAVNVDLQLLNLVSQSKLELQVFAGGKLARVASSTNVQPIGFIQKGTRIFHLHKYMFYKNEKNQWVMIR
ncbi:hypothetical protein SAMN02745866_01000 [Alteromonadaceae bacterium Bs31]|nr:hypothetical protein SAMN02745866_01000 [Alteromonadaceae bacterium Bs31]